MKIQAPKPLHLTAALCLVASVGHAQQIDRIHRELAEAVLANIDSDVRQHYLDPKLRGLKWDAIVGQAKQNIQNAPNIEAAMAQIEGILEQLSTGSSCPPPAISPPVSIRFSRMRRASPTWR